MNLFAPLLSRCSGFERNFLSSYSLIKCFVSTHAVTKCLINKVPNRSLNRNASKGHQPLGNHFCKRFRQFHMMAKSNASELKLFDDVFLQIVTDLTENDEDQREIGDALKHFKEALVYNVPHGKKNRGIAVVISYSHFVKNPTEENLFLARVMGWCIELLQAFLLIADDIMDHSETRRGSACWYKKENIGYIAINDSFYIECAVYAILKKYFCDKPYYLSVIDLFHETTMRTVKGQALDLLTSPETVDFSKFSMERYSAIVKWKTAFYSFCLPVQLAMYMAGISDAESHKASKVILLNMGHFFQVQDDYLDCYGDPEVTGKIGSDIEDNKCSWLINKALEICNADQLKILSENYAQKNKENVLKVKDVYHELQIDKLYHEYELSSYKEIMELIETNCDKLPKDVFIHLANKIYKRKS